MTVSRAGDVTVSRAGDVTVSRAGDVRVSRIGRGNGQQDGEMGWFVNLTSPQPPSKGET